MVVIDFDEFVVVGYDGVCVVYCFFYVFVFGVIGDFYVYCFVVVDVEIWLEGSFYSQGFVGVYFSCNVVVVIYCQIEGV